MIAEEYKHCSDLLQGALNACLKEGILPSRLKVVRPALISKGKGYLCVLDAVGKVLEKFIRTVLIKAIHAANWSPEQFRFQARRSTMDAVMQIVDSVHWAKAHSRWTRRVVHLVPPDSVRYKDILYETMVVYADVVAFASYPVEQAQSRLEILMWRRNRLLIVSVRSSHPEWKRIPIIRPILICESIIEWNPMVKYIGLTFEQIKAAVDNAAAGVSVLSWLVENTGAQGLANAVF